MSIEKLVSSGKLLKLNQIYKKNRKSNNFQVLQRHILELCRLTKLCSFNMKNSYILIAVFFLSCLNTMSDNVLPNSWANNELYILGTYWDDKGSVCLGSIDGKVYFYKESPPGEQDHGFGYGGESGTEWSISQTPKDQIKNLPTPKQLVRIGLYNNWHPESKEGEYPSFSTNILVVLDNSQTLSYYTIIRTQEKYGSYPSYEVGALLGQNEGLNVINFDIIKLQDFNINTTPNKKWYSTLIVYSCPDNWCGANRIDFGYLDDGNEPCPKHISFVSKGYHFLHNETIWYWKGLMKPGGMVLADQNGQLTYFNWNLQYRFQTSGLASGKMHVDSDMEINSFPLAWNMDDPNKHYLCPSSMEPIHPYTCKVDTDTRNHPIGIDESMNEYYGLYGFGFYGLDLNFVDGNVQVNFSDRFFAPTWSKTFDGDNNLCGYIEIDTENSDIVYTESCYPQYIKELGGKPKEFYKKALEEGWNIATLVWGMPITYITKDDIDSITPPSIAFNKTQTNSRAFSKSSSFELNGSVGAGRTWDAGWSLFSLAFNYGYGRSVTDEQSQSTTYSSDSGVDYDAGEREAYYQSGHILYTPLIPTMKKTAWMCDIEGKSANLKLPNKLSDWKLVVVQPIYQLNVGNNRQRGFWLKDPTNCYKDSKTPNDTEYSPLSYGLAKGRPSSNLADIAQDIDKAAKMYQEWQEQYSEDFRILHDEKTIGITYIWDREAGGSTYGYEYAINNDTAFSVTHTEETSTTNENHNSLGFTFILNPHAKEVGGVSDVELTCNWSTAYSTTYGFEKGDAWQVNFAKTTKDDSFYYFVAKIDVLKYRANIKEDKKPVWIPQWAWDTNATFVLMMPWVDRAAMKKQQ